MEQWFEAQGQRILFEQLRRPFALETSFGGEPFVALVNAVDTTITNDDRNAISDALVAAGCRYAVCTGIECSLWDDAVDCANIASARNFEPPADRFVMTSWHDEEPIEEVAEFTMKQTNFDGNEFNNYLVLFVGANAEAKAAVRKAMLAVAEK